MKQVPYRREHWSHLHVSVLTSFIKFNKALTKFKEALTKPYHGLDLSHAVYPALLLEAAAQLHTKDI